MKLLQRLDAVVNRWWMAPEINAAGRLGLYRIVYAIGHLWVTMSIRDYYLRLALLPPDNWSPIASIAWLQPSRPSLTAIQLLAMVLIFCLTLLAIGCFTRLMTLMVLLAGTALTAIMFSIDAKIGHHTPFLVTFIPAVMLFSRWGSSYSLDAWRTAQRGEAPVDPGDESWRYDWPLRLLLIMLAMLYFGAGYYKITSGTWLTDNRLFAKILSYHSYIANTWQLPENPLNPVISQNPPLYLPIHFLALAFETFFPLALLNRRLRNLFLSTAVVFHSLNYIFLKIVFHPMIITYLAFVDWQWLYQRFWPRKRLHLPRLSNTALIALALLAGGLSVAVFSLGHPLQTLLPEPLFWAVATPVSLVLALKYLLAVVRVDLLGSLKRWRGRPRDPDDSTLQAPEVS